MRRAATGLVGLVVGLVLGVVAGNLSAQTEEQPCEATLNGRVVTVDLDTCEPLVGSSLPATTSSEPATPSSSSPTTTSAPSTTVAPTVLPSTTSSSPSTTSPPSSSVSPTTSAPSTTTTAPPAAAAFSEDFFSEDSLARFDRAFSGELHSGSAWGGDIKSWPGDHDLACGDPNATKRDVVMPPGENAEAHRIATDRTVYRCAPANDPARAHLMTTGNSVGYQTVWFAPKPAFANVRKVCFDINAGSQGGGRWAVVNFLTAAEIGSNPDLAFTSPDFANENGASSPRGEARYGVKLSGNAMRSYTYNGTQDFNSWFRGQVSTSPPTLVNGDHDVAPRFRRCVEDLENGRLRLTSWNPDGADADTAQDVRTVEVAGQIPNEPVRIEFADDFYHPDKHCGWDPVVCPGSDSAGGVPYNSMASYSWHWDNVEITTGG